MSGIVGGKNHRGSGLIADLGADGQILTSAGAGVRQIFEAAAGGGANSRMVAHVYSTQSGSQTITYGSWGFEPISCVSFNWLDTMDTYSFGMAHKTLYSAGRCWHNVGGASQVDEAHGSNSFLARFPKSGSSNFDYVINSWDSAGVSINNIQTDTPTLANAYMNILFIG